MTKPPVIFESAILDWAATPQGPVAREIERIAEEVVVTDAHQALSTRFDGGLNPSPGPPHFRTGDLFGSVRVLPAMVDREGVVVNVVADAVHHGFDYPRWLRERQYRFLPQRDYYEYIEQLDN